MSENIGDHRAGEKKNKLGPTWPPKPPLRVRHYPSPSPGPRIDGWESNSVPPSENRSPRTNLENIQRIEHPEENQMTPK